MNQFISFPATIRSHSIKTPEKPALVFGDRTVCWAELGDSIERTAGALRALGVTKGDFVGCYARDAVAFTATFMAVLQLRAVFVPLPTNLVSEVLQSIARDSNLRLIISDAPELLERVQTIDSRPSIVAYSDLSCRGAARIEEAPEPDDVATVLYSSGTTNRPKGVVHSQGSRFQSQASFAERYKVTSRTVTLIGTPLYTALTWASFLPTLVAGGTTVFMPAFSADGFRELATRRAATLSLLVPTQGAMLLEHATTPLWCFDRLIIGGAKTDHALFERLMDASKGRLVEQLGSTETEAVCSLPLGASKKKWGSVGIPLEGVRVKILGKDDIEVPAGEVGEIAVHSPSVMLGYHGSSDNAAFFWRDSSTGRRYYRMGDLGSIDRDGFLWLRGRSKEIIISAGFNIYPTDIEAALLEHPSVRHAAVIGAPSRMLGEVPIAFAESTSPGAATESELCRWLNARLSGKQRVYRVKILERMPVNAAGKILKSGLRSLL